MKLTEQHISKVIKSVLNEMKGDNLQRQGEKDTESLVPHMNHPWLLI